MNAGGFRTGGFRKFGGYFFFLVSSNNCFRISSRFKDFFIKLLYPSRQSFIMDKNKDIRNTACQALPEIFKKSRNCETVTKVARKAKTRKNSSNNLPLFLIPSSKSLNLLSSVSGITE